MKDLLDLNMRIYRLWWESVEANSAAWTTIAMRLPHLAESLQPGATPSHETQTMIAEKVIAIAQGARDASLVTAHLAGKMLQGPIGPTEMAVNMLKVAEAATRPANRRVRANAERLTRKKD